MLGWGGAQGSSKVGELALQINEPLVHVDSGPVSLCSATILPTFVGSDTPKNVARVSESGSTHYFLGP